MSVDSIVFHRRAVSLKSDPGSLFSDSISLKSEPGSLFSDLISLKSDRRSHFADPKSFKSDPTSLLSEIGFVHAAPVCLTAKFMPS